MEPFITAQDYTSHGHLKDQLTRNAFSTLTIDPASGPTENFRMQ